MILKRRQQAGAAMIEMVAVTPLLLLLLLGISELGKAFVQYNTLNKSVREAAREVARKALLGTTGTLSLSSDLVAEGKNLVVYGNVAGLGQPRLPDLAASHVSVTDAGNNLVLIQANYPYAPITGPVLETFGYGNDPATNGITLTASVTMRAL
jgi:Flp pilus assembly protein TadG